MLSLAGRSGRLGQERGPQQLHGVLEEGPAPARGWAVAARVGVKALVDDDAVQLVAAGSIAPSGVGGAVVERDSAGRHAAIIGGLIW